MTKLFPDFNTTLLTAFINENGPIKDAQNTLLQCLQQKTNIEVDASALEDSVMHEMVEKIFEPLSVSVKLESRKHRHWVEVMYGDVDKVTHGHLGMGKEEATWYGSIDGSLRGHGVDGPHGDFPLLSDDAGVSPLSLELKRKAKKLSQAMGSAVLASFTEHHLHPDLNPLMPCILLNCSSFQIVFYDCINDYLLVSEKVNLFYDDDDEYDDDKRNWEVSKTAKLILWLVMNHR
jgi:hypothetical protein